MFIFNHQSALDVLLLCKLLRRDFVGVAKQELRRVPIFGALSALLGTVFIDRANSAVGDRRAAAGRRRAALAACRSRSRPRARARPRRGSRRFKKGAFHMALQARVPIVPIVIKNALDALPKNGLVIRPARIDVVVLPPIDHARAGRARRSTTTSPTCAACTKRCWREV